jgi:alkylhydroperoxidase family enzyme
MDLNAAGLLHEGAGVDKLDEVHAWRESNRFTELERAALAYAEAITRYDLDVDDTVFAAIKAHLSEPELVELTAWICLEGFYSTFNRTFRVEAQGYCRVPWAARRDAGAAADPSA